MSQRIVILTQGYTDARTAKTASCVIRYRNDEVVAILDATQAGKTAFEILGVGENVPVVASLAEAPKANTLLVGVAFPGGRLPPQWRAIILEAISLGMHVISGMHEFISDDPEFVAAAKRKGVQLTDLRKNHERREAERRGIREDCLRIHTVGNDCTVGKMVASLEVVRGLARRGYDAKFVATGQTGIMVEGDGCPIDAVIADFTAGAAEQLVLKNQHHDILVIEGQGSLVQPQFSGVTLALLHGCMPHGLILCYEVGREKVRGMDHLSLPPLAEIKRLNEVMSNLMCPCEVIGIAMNSSKVSAMAAEAERERIRAEFQLPTCDVIRHGPEELVNSVIALRERMNSRSRQA